MRLDLVLLVAFVGAGAGEDDGGSYGLPGSARRTSWEWREKRKRSCEATRRSKAGSAKNARAIELAFGMGRDEGNASDADGRERCPPRHPDLVHFDACTATPVNAAYVAILHRPLRPSRQFSLRTRGPRTTSGASPLALAAGTL